MDIVRRLRSAWDQVGFMGTSPRRVLTVAWWGIRRIEDRVVDGRYRRRGLDSAGPDFGLRQQPDLLAYVPTDWRIIRKLFSETPIDQADVLLEYGCGKGRVALWAALHLSLDRVIGIDIDAELVSAAQNNFARMRESLRCADVSFILADARQFDVPDDVSVIYLFNPFMGEAFETVVAKIGDSLGRRPRCLRILYYYPIMHDSLVEVGFHNEHLHRHPFYAWATYRIN